MNKIFIFILLLIGTSGKIFSRSEIDSLLLVLDKTIEQAPVSHQKMEDKLNGIKELLNDSNLELYERYQICTRLVREYSSFNYDSTLRYINLSLKLGRQLNDPYYVSKSFLLEADLLARTGDYKESLDVMKEVDRNLLKKNSLKVYYAVYSRVYENLDHYTDVEDVRVAYDSLQKKYADSLVRIIDKNSDQYLSILEKRYRDDRQLDSARSINSQRAKNAELGTPLHALVMFHRSLISELENKHEERTKYLTLSAISDISSVNKDNASLTQLALILFDENDVDRAYHYINTSFADVQFFNSKLRFVGIANIFPTITAAYQQRVDQQNEKLRMLVIIVSLLSLGLILMIFSIFKQIKKIKAARNELRKSNGLLKELNVDLTSANEKLHSLNNQLIETDKVKEIYIANFLNICSDFIDKLDNYRRMVRRMVTSRKFEELIQRSTTQEFIDAEVQSFYHTFDTTFLNIYPDFVAKMNELLNEGEKIELKSSELLNTELRIFALIRLGIVDSSDISRLLRYSVNTIYNYRAKIKNRSAVPREEFEEYVMKIDAFKKPSE